MFRCYKCLTKLNRALVADGSSLVLCVRLNLCLGEGMNVAVGVYITALQARKPNAIKLYRDNNEPVRTKTRLYHTQTGSLLLPSDTKRVQVTKWEFQIKPNIYLKCIKESMGLPSGAVV